MAKLLGLLCALVGLSSLAFAADLPAPAPPPVYVPPAMPPYNWTGSYVGINGGWGWGTAKWTVAPIPGTILAPGLSSSINDNGGVVGGTFGFNWQLPGFGGFVFGAEGDWDYSAINTGTTTICNFSGNCQTGNNWLATLRGRAGYAVDRVLFYATAGGAFANMQTSFNGVPTDGHWRAGWTAGAGIEWAFAENWTAKIEYLFVDLGNRTENCTIALCTTGGGFPAAGIPVGVGLTENLVRAGVNFKFYYP